MRSKWRKANSVYMESIEGQLLREIWANLGTVAKECARAGASVGGTIVGDNFTGKTVM